jgi:hypothetical protein
MVKIICEFDTWEEMEQFRVSGKKTRSRKDEDAPTVEEVTEKVAQMNAGIAAATPLPAQSFAPPQAQQASGFPGANGPTPPPPAHPLVAAILARIDGAISSGQPAEAIVTWFRQQIGPDAKDATVEQLKQVFIPRMSKAQLEQIAPQLGISLG